MPVTVDQPAPYAPASALLEMVKRHRSKGLQAPIDADVLARSGISDSLIPRTLQAMRTLDLIEENGAPTEIFEGLRLAPEAEYQQRLAEWLTAAYADALAYVDPETADEVAIRDAFRKYTPTGQQDRMVTLFTGLFTAAGVRPERERAAPKIKAGVRPHKAVHSHTTKQLGRSPTPAATIVQSVAPKLPPALAGLLATLPHEGGSWSQPQRDKFMNAFGVLLDYTFSIEEVGATEKATDE